LTSEVKKAVVLLSGGLDSATVLAIAREQGFELHALSFAYGQRHVWELEAATRVAVSIGVNQHRIVNFDLRAFGASALTDDIAVPKGRSVGEMAHGIPVTYVPARNTIFLSFALAWAEVIGSSDIFIGVNALDYSGYPDCSSCYDPSARGEPCGDCDSCLLRKKGFRENGMEDPLIYKRSADRVEL